MYKSGFVSIIGKPNAGKSTLLNALLGQKLSIITPKAQTTRHRIQGIDSTEAYQIVYSDTPGVIRPKYKLHEKMMSAVVHSLDDADVIVLLIAVDESFPEEDLLVLANKTKVPRILAMNKTDIAMEGQLQSRREHICSIVTFDEIIDLSALEGDNVAELKSLILKHLPEGVPYFDPEEMSDRPERFFVSEIVREQLFLLMFEEIPYSCEVVVVKFDETDKKMFRIHAEIHVERRNQKAMIIGKDGQMLKKIGTAARLEIEKFLDKKVYLELYVRVTEDWKDSNLYLKNFGY